MYNFDVCLFEWCVLLHHIGVHTIARVGVCRMPKLITNYFNDDLLTMRVKNGVFVLLVGVSLHFIATFFALRTPYLCCRIFGKCQHRGWRILLCSSAAFGIFSLLITIATLTYSIHVGVSFYPLTQKEFEIFDCFRIQYYSTFIFLFLLIAHVVSSVVVVVCLIVFVIIFVHGYVVNKY